MTKKTGSKFTNIANKDKIKICNNCNPKLYLKFNFSFITFEGKCDNIRDVFAFYERMKELSSEPYFALQLKYSGNKNSWFESIPVNKIQWKTKKEIPKKFRELFPIETNEKYEILRVYPSGTPNNTANPRIIGMIKNTIFYIFYMDWKGELYKH